MLRAMTVSTMSQRFRRIAVAAMLLCMTGPGVVHARPPAPGDKAPDFTLRANTGKNIKLSELRGQVVMINFWATWCGPCRQEMPHLERLHDQYRRAGFALLGVNLDENSKSAESLARELGVRFPVLFDSGKKISGRYDVDAMPSTLLIDRSGVVRYLHRGYRSGVENEYEAKIRELLKQ
jgi:peroxiredoxin